MLKTESFFFPFSRWRWETGEVQEKINKLVDESLRIAMLIIMDTNKLIYSRVFFCLIAYQHLLVI